MPKIEVWPSSISPGEELRITVRGAPIPPRPDHLRINVFRVEELETSWYQETSPECRVRATTIYSRLPATEQLTPDSPYEIRRVELLTGETPIAVLLGGRDFARTFFYVVELGSAKRKMPEVRLQALDVEERRRLLFAQPLGGPWSPSLQQFRVLSFVHGCLLTRRFEFPGFSLRPISAERVGEDEALLVNFVLAQGGWNCSLPVEEWSAHRVRASPIVVAEFPRVLAASFEDASEITASALDRVLDLLALHRGAAGSPFVTILENLETREAHAEHQFPAYHGNLLGGFISGEDQPTLIRQNERIAADPLMALWVSLVGEAEQEQNVDFLFLRYWGILETIATARVADGQVVVNFAGSPITVGGGSVVTGGLAGTRGAVSDLWTFDVKRPHRNGAWRQHK